MSQIAENALSRNVAESFKNPVPDSDAYDLQNLIRSYLSRDTSVAKFS